MATDASQVLIEVGAKDSASQVLEGAFSRIDSHFRKFMRGVSEASSKVDRFSRDMLRVGGRMDQMIKNSPFSGGLLGGGLMSELPIGRLAVGGTLTAIVKNFASLEEAMVDVGTSIENLTDSQLESLKRKIMDVGEEFPASNVDVARTVATMGRRGYDFNAIMANLREVVMLDIASRTENTTETANSVMSVMQSLNKAADQFKTVTDQMMATRNFFGERASIPNLGTAFIKSGTDIKEKGISDTEALAILGTAMQQGLSPEESSTGFNAMIRDIETKALKNFKRKDGSFDPQMKPFLGSDMKFNSILDFIDEMVKRQVDFRTVFQDESIRSARMIAQNRDQIRKFMTEKVGSEGPGMPDRSSGAVETQYAARKNTFNLKLQELMGSLENLGNALAESGIMDAVIAVVEELTSVVKKAKDIDPDTLKMIVKGFLGLLVGGTLLSGMASLISSLTTIGSVLVPLIPVILSAEAALAAGAVAFGAFVFALDDFMPKIKQAKKDIGEAILKDLLSVFNIDYETDADRRAALYSGVAQMMADDEKNRQSLVRVRFENNPPMSVKTDDSAIDVLLGGRR